MISLSWVRTSSIMARTVELSWVQLSKECTKVNISVSLWALFLIATLIYQGIPRFPNQSLWLSWKFSWQELHCPIHSKKNGLCIKIFKDFVPCRILVYRPKKVGLPSLNILSCLCHFVLHLVSFFIAVNTTKDFMDFMKYSTENFASVTSCVVLVITYLDVIVSWG